MSTTSTISPTSTTRCVREVAPAVQHHDRSHHAVVVYRWSARVEWLGGLRAAAQIREITPVRADEPTLARWQ